MDFSELVISLSTINRELREQSIRAVNTALTIRNWIFGYYIVEFEQKGYGRAEYGKGLLAAIAKEMSGLRIPNTDERELRRCRQFYLVYSGASGFILSDARVKGILGPAPPGNQIENSLTQIRGTASPESPNDHIENTITQIRGTPSPEFQVPDSHIENDLNQIRGLANPEFQVTDIHYTKLFNKVSYTHFVELIRIDDPFKRLFYELECVKGVWSIKELRRQIGSLLFERTGLSRNKEKLLALANEKAVTQTFADILRDPYLMDFIGFKREDVLRENELEQALLDHLLQFLLELGKGFCFEARQKRIVIDNEHHFIDLVFYHRTLHCNVLIDLKTERFNYAHAGQLNMYVEYYKKYEMAPGDNPPVGILLCSDKDKEHVEFATAGMDDNVFVSQYLVGLPDKRELEQFIKKEVRENER